MSWESFDWKPADGAPLGAGASILPLWPMLRSAIAEGISADALCPVTIGELTVGHIKFSEAAYAARGCAFVRVAGNRPTRRLGRSRPGQGRQDRRQTSTAAERLQELVLESMDGAFESILGEGLGLGAAVEISSPDAPMLLLRLPITSVDNEELILISAYDEAVAEELSAHVVALQALASEASHAGSRSDAGLTAGPGV